jgi:threonine dehydratase
MPHPASPDLTSIRAAQANLQGQVTNSPCLLSQTLSAISGAQVYLKFENLQFTASFKERGALNKLCSLTDAQRQQGVIAVSAGNHAQGVAYHASRLGIPATIVMPQFTPTVKVERTQAFGAEVVLHGEGFDEAKVYGFALAESRNLVMIHPYDDVDVIAGQGTIGLELLDQQPNLDCIIVAIGGGGLISGLAIAAKSLKPTIEIIGAQTDCFPSMYNDFHGKDAPMGQSSIADGISVREPGLITKALVKEWVDDVILVEESAIEEAILALLEIEKTVVEGAGAVGLAALLSQPDRFAGKSVGLILCGGNIDPLTLGDIIKRGMVRSGRLVRIQISLRDRPGALASVSRLIAEQQANIIQVQHHREFTQLAAQNTEVEVVMQTRGWDHVEAILRSLQENAFPAQVSNY